MDLQNNKIKDLIDNVETVIRGKHHELKLVVTVLLAGGHILVEDNPGTGKTVMAKTLAQSISDTENMNELLFRRIQFTPDLLPMDLIGAHIFDDNTKDFLFRKGPLFCNVLLADEINRASPKVQSALLESMAEQQITVGNTTYQLEKLFFIIATQNPIEMEGTYPLPAAQLDRFFMKINFGYANADAEMDIYRNYLQIEQNILSVKKILNVENIFFLKKITEDVFVHEEILQSIYNIINNTRHHTDITLGASVRSGITFIRCLKAYALVNGRDFVIEDDINDLAHAVLHHRLIFNSREARKTALYDVVNKEITRLSKLNLYAAKHN
jgi:MoxR-like ATPase